MKSEQEIMLRECRLLVAELLKERSQLRAERQSLHEQVLDLAVELEALRAKAGQ